MRFPQGRFCLVLAVLTLSLASWLPTEGTIAGAARFRSAVRVSRRSSQREMLRSSLRKFGKRVVQTAGRGVGRGLRRLGYRSQPAFIIIGTQKGGTWALRHYLASHPKVIGSVKQEEIHFFDQDRLFLRGMEWYSTRFPLPHELRGGRQTFEHTTSYMYYPKAAERINRHLPGVRLIVLLREPIKRAFSSWNMFRQFRESPNQIVRQWRRQFDPPALEQLMSFLSRDPFPDFATAVRQELDTGRDGEVYQPGLIRRGYYDEQLARIFAIFGRDQVLVLESSQLRSRSREVLNRTTEFLGLPQFEWPDHVLVPHHAREYADTIDSDTRLMLAEVFRPHNDRLFELLGVDLGWNRTA